MPSGIILAECFTPSEIGTRFLEGMFRHLTVEMQIHGRNIYFLFKGPYHPFCMFEPNIFNFHTCYVTDNHSPKDKTVFQLS
ncbi:hypothetical protein LDENG_00082100 [Lucifuga dentata]|nr:hypothetical protein LDENG_00082100 [Lucifuga dentata]